MVKFIEVFHSKEMNLSLLRSLRSKIDNGESKLKGWRRFSIIMLWGFMGLSRRKGKFISLWNIVAMVRLRKWWERDSRKARFCVI